MKVSSYEPIAVQIRKKLSHISEKSRSKEPTKSRDIDDEIARLEADLNGDSDSSSDSDSNSNSSSTSNGGDGILGKPDHKSTRDLKMAELIELTDYYGTVVLLKSKLEGNI